MKTILNYIKKLVKNTCTSTSIEEQWLAQSTSLEEVERRQRMIMRGQAPWQKIGGLY